MSRCSAPPFYVEILISRGCGDPEKSKLQFPIFLQTMEFAPNINILLIEPCVLFPTVAGEMHFLGLAVAILLPHHGPRSRLLRLILPSTATSSIGNNQ